MEPPKPLKPIPAVRCMLFVVMLMLAASLGAQTVVQVEKPEFLALVPENATLEAVATGFQFLEGPAWNLLDETLTFSDIPGNRLYRFDPAAKDAAPQIFREPSNHANGNTFDLTGELITCEHGSRRVSRTHDGVMGTVAERYEGKLLNSPNDAVVKRDGTIWFTDPTYGLEGRAKEQDANHVFCVDAKTGQLRAVASDFDQPNGLCFSPDESRLYIADSQKPHHVRVFDVTVDNTLTNGRVFCVIDPGAPDGMRCDREGNLWSSAGDGIHVYNPRGERLGKILVPQTPANLCFGGPSGNDLYITARKTLYQITTATTAPPAASKTR